jgi:hypothetical protein
MVAHHIEHRYEARTEAVLLVEVWHRDRRLGTFTTRDVCRGGMFIETGPIGLKANDFVRVRLLSRRETYEVPGLVAHCSRYGTGVLCELPAVAVAEPVPLARAVGF